MGRRHRLAYPILLLLGAVDAAGYSLMAPVSPAIARSTAVGPSVIGLLVATFPLAMLAGFVAAGRAIERDRTKIVLVVSLLLVGTGALGFVFGSGLAAYFAARLLMGLGSGGVWLGVTFGILERWPGTEYRRMSRLFASYSAGGLIGPALGAIGGVEGPFLAYAVLIGICVVLVLVLPEPHVRRAFRSDWSAVRVAGFWLACAGVLFVYLGYGVVEGVLPLHLSAGLSQAALGATYVGMSIVVALASAAGGWFRPAAMLAASLVFVTAGLTAAGLTDLVLLWLLALAITGVGFGLGTTGSVGILLEAVHPERIVTAMVIWSQLGIIGYLVGPVAAGAIADTLGFGALGVVPLAGGAGVVLTMLLRRSKPSRLV